MGGNAPGGPKDPELVLCGADNQSASRKGTTCKRSPLPGTNRCGRHGGTSPQALRIAPRRILEEKTLIAMARMDIIPVSNPFTALSELAGEIVNFKDVIASHVARLKSPALRTLEGEQVKAEILVYERALDRSVQVLAVIAKLNIDERLAAIEERQAQQVERALLAALDALQLSADQRTLAERELTRHLRVVA